MEWSVIVDCGWNGIYEEKVERKESGEMIPGSPDCVQISLWRQCTVSVCTLSLLVILITDYALNGILRAVHFEIVSFCDHHVGTLWV